MLVCQSPVIHGFVSSTIYYPAMRVDGFLKKNNAFFILFLDVEIDLLAQYFKPTKKYYERVKRSFQRMQIKLKFLVSSVSNPGDTCTYTVFFAYYLAIQN